jgi:hypothetical protein
MNQVTKYLDKVEKHINAGFDLADAMAQFAPVFNKLKPLAQLEVRSNIARLISVKKKVATVEITAGVYAGSLGFTAKHKGGSKESEQARVMLGYYLPTTKVETSSTPKKKGASKVTPVDRIKSRVTKFVKEHKKSDIQERLDELAIEMKLLKQFV